MTTIVTRAGKGTPLTNTEVDTNFTNLNTDKLELGGTFSSGTANSVLFLNASKVATSGSALTFDGTNLFVGTSTNTNSSRIVSAGTISETVSSVQYLVASQYDVGTAANQLPLNQYLGNLAYQDAGAIAGPVGLGGVVTLYAGTANGVAYLDASKVLTTGSALTFNGTTFNAPAITENSSPAVVQSDLGTSPNEVPINQYLGAMAFEDTETPALGVGTGITTGTGTICKANGGLMGGIFQMSILIDLTGLNSGGTAGDIIGVNGTALPCYIALIPAMTVLGGRMTCLETPAGGDTDIDLYSAAEGTGVEDQAISALTETEIINAGAQTRGTVTYFSADPAANTYFYLVGQGTANATYTAGRFLIEIFGVQ